MFIDRPRPIAETLYFSLNCASTLQDKGLRYVFDLIFHKIYSLFQMCIDLASESLTEQSLVNELFTDSFKSELMETLIHLS
ncbi:hypothetical protein NIES25_18340 [Nostoc linckia NIES-25]|nr:hypothetical protein NIES25_18340 [Nostoc linckia NIES-25]